MNDIVMIVEMIHRHLRCTQSKPPPDPAGVPYYLQKYARTEDGSQGSFKTD